MTQPENLRMDNLLRRFRKYGIAVTIIAYMVVLAGGVVRMTGSGMGCPDWPRCFGRWVPPTDVNQLPPDYRERYAVDDHEVEEFNAAKTWTEYVNRLVSVLLGFAMIPFLWTALRFRKNSRYRYLTYMAFAALLLVLFEAWMGAKVVSSNLASGKITAHMLLAVALICLLLFTIFQPNLRLHPVETSRTRLLRGVLVGAFLLTLIQIGLGSQVREYVDLVSRNLADPNRASWLEQVGGRYILHRTFSWLVGLGVAVSFVLVARSAGGTLRKVAAWALVLLILELFSGITLAYLDMPAAVQPLHLLMATGLAGLQFWLVIAAFWQLRPSPGILNTEETPSALTR